MHLSSIFALGIFANTAIASPTFTSERSPSRVIEKRSAHTKNPGGCLEVQGTNPTSSQYKSLTLAVAALTGTNKCIFIWPGTYSERVTIQFTGGLTIYGYTVK